MSLAVVRLALPASGAAEAVAALQQRCFEDAWPCPSIAEILAMPGVFCFVAAAAGRPCGFALCRIAADEAEVLSLGVVPEARRKGAARRLLRAGLRCAAEHAVRRVYLEVASDNVAARGLYCGCGFETVAVRANYYNDRGSPPRDALVLALDLHAACAAAGSRTRTTSRRLGRAVMRPDAGPAEAGGQGSSG